MGDEISDNYVTETLLGLRLPAQYTVYADSFVELMGGLSLAERNEKDIVSRSFRYLDDAL